MTAAGTLMAQASLPEPSRRMIPFEQSFVFDLLGENRTLKQAVVVSVEAPFTATSIGYGFVPVVESVPFAPSFGPPVILLARGGLRSVLPAAPPPNVTLDDISLAEILLGAAQAFSSRPEFGRGNPVRDTVARAGIQ